MEVSFAVAANILPVGSRSTPPVDRVKLLSVARGRTNIMIAGLEKRLSRYTKRVFLLVIQPYELTGPRSHDKRSRPARSPK